MEENNSQFNPQTPAGNDQSPKKKLTLFSILLILVLVVAIAFLVYYSRNHQNNISDAVKMVYEPKVLSASKFGTYEETPVSIKPSIKPYKVEADLSNLINRTDFDFSDQAKKLLEKNAFVVIPSYYHEFFPIYEANRYGFIPNFITTDSILHNYHLMFDHSLKVLEEQKLIPELKKLNSQMLAASLSQYNSLKGTEWENAAKRNVGFFTVGSKLSDPNVVIPTEVKSEVEKELALISTHAGIDFSPVMGGLKEDYSQYIPRGHYDKTKGMKAYFKSMMWYGRLTFVFKESDSIKSSILISLALNQNDNLESWQKLYEPINFFVGKSDDIGYYQVRDLVDQVYGQNPSLNLVAKDNGKLVVFTELTKKLAPPQINSMPIMMASINPDRENETKGFRFMGQRFTVDASIFQRLIVRDVGPKGESCDKAPFNIDGARMLPMGLDIPAAMGSGEASKILKSKGEFDYACYPENMSKMQNYIANLSKDTWTQNLYWGWMYSLAPLISQKTEGYPSFMTNQAWTRKDLNTYLGSWTELKHDTILYAKQVYAEMGGGMPDEKDDRGYVEPNPYVYARLVSLLKMTNDGLSTRGLLDDSSKTNFDLMIQIATKLKNISEKELNGTALTADDYDFIKTYGGQLEHLWLEVNKNEPEFLEYHSSAQNFLNDNPSALVADVATDPNGQVLEEGTGYVSEIYVVVPIEGKLRIAKGGIYSYYEFPWPLSDRLTDRKWKDLLDQNKAPKLPDWTDSFTVPRYIPQ